MGRFHAFTNANFVRLVERNTELESQNNDLQQRIRSLETQLYETRLVSGDKTEQRAKPKPIAPNKQQVHVRRQSRLGGFVGIIVAVSAVWFFVVTAISLLR